MRPGLAKFLNSSIHVNFQFYSHMGENWQTIAVIKRYAHLGKLDTRAGSLKTAITNFMRSFNNS